MELWASEKNQLQQQQQKQQQKQKQRFNNNFINMLAGKKRGGGCGCDKKSLW
jgi:hypothetical protein